MRGTPFQYAGFVGGLNTIDSPYTLKDDEARDCLNVVATTRGAIRKRTGSTLLTGAPPAVELHSVFAATIAGTKWLIAAGGGNLYSITTGGVVAQIGTGFNATARWSMVQAPASTGVPGQGPVYMANGIDAPQYWTGVGETKPWTGVASHPKPTDGVGAKGTVVLSSATAGFVPSDIGVTIKFESEVKVGGVVIVSARITAVLSSKEVTLELAGAGWEAAYAAVHFSLERPYYASEPHVPNGEYSVFAGNRIWMTGLTADPSAVWFSDIASTGEGGGQSDPSAWPTANVVRFDGSDGYPITGIGTIGPYVVVFKENKTWIIHDLNTGANRRLADNIGCVSHRSIVETAMGTFFLTADQGVYLTDGSHLHEMSYTVRPTLLGMNQGQRQNTAGCYFNNHYYLSFPAGASPSNNRTLDYDVQLKSWWLHDLAANQWTRWEPGSEANLYACLPGISKSVVRAFVPNVYTDSGANYAGANGLAAYWFGAWQVFSMFIFRHRIATPFLKKRIRQIHFDGSGEIIPIVARGFNTSGTQEPGAVANEPESSPTLPVDFSQNEAVFANPNEAQIFGGDTFEGRELIFGGAASTTDARLYSLGVSRAWSVGFGNNTVAPFEVDSYTYMIQFRKS